MFRLLHPSDTALDSIVESCAEREPNHPVLESVDLAAPPAGFQFDNSGTELGRGEDVWLAARAALDARAMYPLVWTSVHAASELLVPGAALVSVVRHFGFHSVLPGRVCEVFDDTGPVHRYGFAFLTLEGHPEQGRERFAVSWDQATDVVRYDITSISRPIGLARLATPIARSLQARFRRDSVASMIRATAHHRRGAMGTGEQRR